MNTFKAYLIFSILSTLILILLYFLTVRRKSVEFSAIFLWKRIKTAHNERPFLKRFYRERLFYIHLSILTLLLSALILFSLGKTIRGGGAEKVIFIMDTSASMKTLENGKSRFDLARERALSLLNGFRSPEVMIITAGNPVKTVLSFTTDRNAIENVLKAIEPEDTGDNFQEVILRTKAYMKKHTPIYIFGDGASKNFLQVTSQYPDLFFYSVGKDHNNVAILDVKPYWDNGNVTVLVKNFHGSLVRTTVDLLINGEIADAQGVEIPAGGDSIVTFKQTPQVPGIINVKVGYHDSFPLDNHWYGIQASSAPKSILMVTKGNYFLEHFLKQVDSSYLVVMNPEKYEEEVSKDNKIAFDIVIYDNYTPHSRVNSANITYINPDKNTEEVYLADGYIKPTGLNILREHPIMEHTDFSDIQIWKARKVKTFKGVTLLGSPDLPLIISSDQSGKKRVVINFDLQESNFPLSVNFPIFFTNMLSWFQSDAESHQKYDLISGDIFILPLTERFIHANKAMVQSPGGKVWNIDINKGMLVFPHTQQAGIYKVIFENGGFDFAVNIDPTESDLRPLEDSSSSMKNKRGVLFPSFFSSVEIWKILGVIVVILLFYEEKLREKPG